MSDIGTMAEFKCHGVVASYLGQKFENHDLTDDVQVTQQPLIMHSMLLYQSCMNYANSQKVLVFFFNTIKVPAYQ